jgi:hypothetical protein
VVGVHYSRNNTITICFNGDIAQITSESARKEGEPPTQLAGSPTVLLRFFLAYQINLPTTCMTRALLVKNASGLLKLTLLAFT